MARGKHIIIGAGGHCRAVIDCITSRNGQIEYILDINYTGRDEVILGIPVGSYQDLITTYNPEYFSCALAIGDNRLREKLFNELKSKNYSLPPLIHATAYASGSVILEEGCFIGAGCILNSLCHIRHNTIINTGAIIEHETTVGPHCHIGPGSRIAGRVEIGEGTFLGIGVSVIDKVHIGSNVTVGAGSVVLRNIEPGHTVAGIPAKPIK